eukprot:TRINITY_DN91595_c0_g1_i1.p1 TRINITY_DN91595_c0_g1~~TRINITY_DN91595_c0_g1_i1.p1  ORF type:complete len:270 (-),score=62.01 TRINITY_DN91595_c0_g1_i1:266-1075(-)
MSDLSSVAGVQTMGDLPSLGMGRSKRNVRGATGREIFMPFGMSGGGITAREMPPEFGEACNPYSGFKDDRLAPSNLLDEDDVDGLEDLEGLLPEQRPVDPGSMMKLEMMLQPLHDLLAAGDADAAAQLLGFMGGLDIMDAKMHMPRQEFLNELEAFQGTSDCAGNEPVHEVLDANVQTQAALLKEEDVAAKAAGGSSASSSAAAPPGNLAAPRRKMMDDSLMGLLSDKSLTGDRKTMSNGWNRIMRLGNKGESFRASRNGGGDRGATFA